MNKDTEGMEAPPEGKETETNKHNLNEIITFYQAQGHEPKSFSEMSL